MSSLIEQAALRLAQLREAGVELPDDLALRRATDPRQIDHLNKASSLPNNYWSSSMTLLIFPGLRLTVSSWGTSHFL